jgi:hypothetical protein
LEKTWEKWRARGHVGLVDMFVEYAREAIENDYRPYLVPTYGKRAFTVAESTLTRSGSTNHHTNN